MFDETCSDIIMRLPRMCYDGCVEILRDPIDSSAENVFDLLRLIDK